MIKVITYGTYDLLHYGHIRLLERAKALGDYLIVGVTADDFDKSRGKINVQQSLIERIEAVRATGLADEIVVEEYEGQKIDDIRKYDVDIFTVGSDWIGKFDYLKEYCKVVYLDRTEGISSSEIRAEKREIRLGLVGDSSFLNKVYRECNYVNGLNISAVYSNSSMLLNNELIDVRVETYDELLNKSDAVYIRSLPELHYCQTKVALHKGKHVICESPIALDNAQTEELIDYAYTNGLVLMDAIKTAYSTAYNRLLLLVKSGIIGDIVTVDTTCTSLLKSKTDWNGFFEWAPTALLPIFQLLGKQKSDNIINVHNPEGENVFSRIILLYENSIASATVGDGVKSEGHLIISGTKGYIYVPAPWWKTDYFEVRYENQNDNKRYFYQLEGEGIRYEFVEFLRSIRDGNTKFKIDRQVSLGIVDVCAQYQKQLNS